MIPIWIFIIFIFEQAMASGVALLVAPWTIGQAVANGVSVSIGPLVAVLLVTLSAGLLMIFFLAAVLLCMLKKCALIKK